MLRHQEPRPQQVARNLVRQELSYTALDRARRELDALLPTGDGQAVSDIAGRLLHRQLRQMNGADDPLLKLFHVWATQGL